ncbi:MAG: GNAT family N-acetyltransferase [Fibrobacterales bacterium]
MKPVIRIATIDDVDSIVPLLTELYDQVIDLVPDPQAQQTGISKIISNPDIGTVLIALINKNVIGVLNIQYSISAAKGGVVANFDDLIITKEYQSKGMGAYLLQAGIDHVKKLNIPRISLLTDFDNDTAIAFYEKHGFSKSAMIPFVLQIDNR